MSIDYAMKAMEIRFGDWRKKTLFVHICAHASDPPELLLKTTMAELSADYGRTPRTTRKYLDLLERDGWIRVHKDPFSIRVLKVSK